MDGEWRAREASMRGLAQRPTRPRDTTRRRSRRAVRLSMRRQRAVTARVVGTILLNGRLGSSGIFPDIPSFPMRIGTTSASALGAITTSVLQAFRNGADRRQSPRRCDAQQLYKVRLKEEPKMLPWRCRGQCLLHSQTSSPWYCNHSLSCLLAQTGYPAPRPHSRNPTSR